MGGFPTQQHFCGSASDEDTHTRRRLILWRITLRVGVIGIRNQDFWLWALESCHPEHHGGAADVLAKEIERIVVECLSFPFMIPSYPCVCSVIRKRRDVYDVLRGREIG